MRRQPGAPGAADLCALVALLLLAPSVGRAAPVRRGGGGSSYANSISADPQLDDWLAETYAPGDAQSSVVGSQRGGLQVLSWDPRIFVYRNFLSDEECDAIKTAAAPRLYRSGVVDAVTGASKNDDIRTSKGMFFTHAETPFIKTIEERLARITMTHPYQGEGIQVLKYQIGEKYGPHHDYFSHAAADEGGGNRLVTALMYLSDVEEGGETVFPKVAVPAGQKKEHYSECAMQGLAHKPRKGDVTVFWSIRNDGTFDHRSLHGSCPVIKGEKWSATKWIHIAKLNQGHVERVKFVPPPPPDVAGCTNRQTMCQHWAESGECEDNPGYMIATKERPGDCLKACNRCDLGPNDPDFKGIYAFNLPQEHSK
mmetsp:Transcript_19849/g.58984  ORF Transcript_19849/g.58984 Transcript_19849/m.58984 type:complete len:368 (-) Transcript_19849:230-1333(-)